MEGLTFGANEKKMGWRAQPTRQVFMENVSGEWYIVADSSF